MKRMKLIMAALLLATSFSSFAQMPKQPDDSRLIAVVNTANWCSVCKANGARFGAVLMSYASHGVSIYMNDLTNDSTKAASKLVLENAAVYEAVTTIPRKGMGKMLKSCGLAKDKKQSVELSGIVTFIDASTHKQVKQISIAESDEVMIKTIDNLLN